MHAALAKDRFDLDPLGEKGDSKADITAIEALASTELATLVREIDAGYYPAALMRKFGEANAYARQLDDDGGIGTTIAGMAAISQTCLSTGFMNWCQNTLLWYISNSDNQRLKDRFLDPVSSGKLLGGTGLSNPMKSIFGIETLKLRGQKVGGGYRIRGSLPWVSNLQHDHIFGTVFEIADSPGGTVMCLIDCADPAVTLKPCEPFLAMDGTGTYAVQIRDLLVRDDMILADPALPFIRKIRAGFILLQAGMAIGLVRDCVAMMDEVDASLGHVNRFLDVQPKDIANELDTLESEVSELAETPYNSTDHYWRRVVSVRLSLGELSVAAAHHAMLHCGARGYVGTHRCQRRLREAYFVAIVTPATKQLRKMLAEMP